MALPIFVSLDNLDGSLLEAAGDLGANRWRTLLRVTLPLSKAGLMAAFVFVFVPTIGEFVTPQIVGGVGRRIELPVRQRDQRSVPTGARLAERLGDGPVPADRRGRT